jgi:hypothetical protein
MEEVLDIERPLIKIDKRGINTLGGREDWPCSKILWDSRQLCDVQLMKNVSSSRMNEFLRWLYHRPRFW